MFGLGRASRRGRSGGVLPPGASPWRNEWGRGDTRASRRKPGRRGVRPRQLFRKADKLAGEERSESSDPAEAPGTGEGLAREGTPRSGRPGGVRCEAPGTGKGLAREGTPRSGRPGGVSCGPRQPLPPRLPAPPGRIRQIPGGRKRRQPARPERSRRSPEGTGSAPRRWVGGHGEEPGRKRTREWESGLTSAETACATLLQTWGRTPRVGNRPGGGQAAKGKFMFGEQDLQ